MPDLGPGALGGLTVPGESIICTWTTNLALATDAVSARRDAAARRTGSPASRSATDRTTLHTTGGDVTRPLGRQRRRTGRRRPRPAVRPRPVHRHPATRRAARLRQARPAAGRRASCCPCRPRAARASWSAPRSTATSCSARPPRTSTDRTATGTSEDGLRVPARQGPRADAAPARGGGHRHLRRAARRDRPRRLPHRRRRRAAVRARRRHPLHRADRRAWPSPSTSPSCSADAGLDADRHAADLPDPPRMPNLGEAATGRTRTPTAIAADPEYGRIVCFCERVTARRDPRRLPLPDPARRPRRAAPPHPGDERPLPGLLLRRRRSPSSLRRRARRSSRDERAPRAGVAIVGGGPGRADRRRRARAGARGERPGPRAGGTRPAASPGTATIPATASATCGASSPGPRTPAGSTARPRAAGATPGDRGDGHRLGRRPRARGHLARGRPDRRRPTPSSWPPAPANGPAPPGSSPATGPTASTPPGSCSSSSTCTTATVGSRAVVVGAELVSWSAVLTLREAGCRTVLMTTAYPRPEATPRSASPAGSLLRRRRSLTAHPGRRASTATAGSRRSTSRTCDTGQRHASSTCDTRRPHRRLDPRPRAGPDRRARPGPRHPRPAASTPRCDQPARRVRGRQPAAPGRHRRHRRARRRHVAAAVTGWLDAATSPPTAARIRTDAPFDGLCRSLFPPGRATPPGRSAAVERRVPPAAETARRAGRPEAGDERTPWPAAPGRVYRAPWSLVAGADPTGGDVTLSLA